MHKAYSLDLRERAVAAVESGLLQAQVVRLFGVSLAHLEALAAQAAKGLEPGLKGLPAGLPGPV